MLFLLGWMTDLMYDENDLRYILMAQGILYRLFPEALLQILGY